MNTLTAETTQSKGKSKEDQKAKGRYYYNTKVKHMSHDEAMEKERRYQEKHGGNPLPVENVATDKLKAKAERKAQYEREKQAKKEAISYYLPLPVCPVCGCEFLKRKEGKVIPMKLPHCIECNVRFYIAGAGVPTDRFTRHGI